MGGKLIALICIVDFAQFDGMLWLGRGAEKHSLLYHLRQSP